MIDPTLEVPFVGSEIDGSGAGSETPAKPKRALLVGLRSSTGTVAELVPTLISGDGEEDLAFGRNSMLADMCRGFRLANKFTELWACAIDEPSSGTAGTQTLTPVGTATAAGELPLYIGNVRYPVPVISGDDDEAMAAAIGVVVAANGELPVTGGVAAEVFTATNNHKGDYEVRIEIGGRTGDVLPAGVTGVTIAAGATAAGTIDITEVTDILGDVEYDRIVIGMHTDTILDAAELALAERWAALVETDGIVMYAHKGASLSTITTYGAAPARNSQYGSLIAPPDSSFPTPVWRTAAMVAGVDLAEATVNTPRQFLPLPGINPGVGTRFDLAQRNLLIKAGCSTLKVDAGGRVVIDRLVTTYQKNAAGAPDKLFQSLGVMAALSYIRWMWRVRIQTRYPRALLGDDGAKVAPGIPLMTPSTMKAEALAWFDEAAALGLLDSSTKAAFKDALSSVRPSGNANRLDNILPPTLMAQFLQSATTIRPQL